MHKLLPKIHSLFILLVTAGLVMGIGEEVKGQCVPKIRTYANFQGSYLEGLGVLGLPTIIGSISNSPNAINTNPAEFSTLTIPVGLAGLATVTQYLEFTTDGNHANKRTIAGGTPVSLKFTLPTEVLGLLSGVEIGTFNNLNPTAASWPTILGSGNSAGYNSTSKVVAYSGATLLSLLNGAGDFEITINPVASYNGVYLKLSGNGLALALSANIYHAYILENTVGSNSCYNPTDVLAGIRAGALANLATATGTVNNKWNAIDNDPSASTYTELAVGAQVLSNVFHTTIFKTKAQAGDAVQMIIQKPGGGLLDLNVLNGFSIQMFDGTTPIGSAYSSSSGLLSLSLLPGSTSGNEKYTLTIPVPKADGAFDRVEVKLGGLATVGLTPGLRIYNVKHIILPRPTIDGTILSSKTLCRNSTATLSISENQDCTTYNWYNISSGGSILTTGTSYTPTAASLVNGANTFYVEAIRTNCTETSGRIPVTIVVNNVDAGTISSSQAICSGTLPNSFTQTAATGAGTITYQWQKSTDNVNFTSIPGATSATYAESATLTQATYYQRVATSTLNGVNCNATTAKIAISINPLPLITPSASPHVCQGITSSTIGYTNPIATPTIYSITWNNAALLAGLTNVPETALPSSSIPINIPANIATATYSGTIIVKNANGCQSSAISFSVVVHTRPPAPHITSQ